MKTAGSDSPIEHEPPVAVILAAGEGRRLRDGGSEAPKPLTRIAGLSLAERSICGLSDPFTLLIPKSKFFNCTHADLHHLVQIILNCHPK